MTDSSTVIQRSGALALRFELLLKNSGSDEQFLRDVAAHSACGRESPWESLAAIDQLYRRGKLSAALFRAARIDIERRALGVRDAAVATNVKPLRSVAPARAVATREAAAGEFADTDASEHELRQLRAELEQARRDAASYLQRLEQLTAIATAAAAERPLTPVLAAPTRSMPVAPMTALPVAPMTMSPSMPMPMPSPSPPELSTPSWMVLAARDAGPPAATSPRSLWSMRLLWLVAGAVLLARLPAPQRSELPASGSATANATAVTTAEVAPVALQPGVLALEQDRFVATAGERQVTIVVHRTGGSDGDVTLPWRIGAATARHGHDFGGALRGVLRLPSGATDARIVIPLPRNPARQHTEFFDVRLAQPGGGALLGEQQRATVFLMPAPRVVRPRTQRTLD